jgi:uroporphyrinogen-III synthase
MSTLAEACPVALFRAHEDAALTAGKLAERGIAAILAPVTELAAVSAAPPQPSFDFALVTSAKAFAFAPVEWLDVARALPLYVVGERTAAAARARGLSPEGDVAADAAELASRLAALPGRALYLAGRDRKPDLEAALGGRATVVEVYEARERSGWSDMEARAVGGAAAALHYSERGAALAVRFAEAAGVAAAFRAAPHVCLSRQVAAPLADFGVIRALWPQSPNEEALFDTLESALADFPRR